MMLDGRWVTGRSARDLAAAWGLSQSTVENYATEASRTLRAALGDGEGLEARAQAMVENFIRQAADMGQMMAAMKGMEILLGVRRTERELARLQREVDKKDDKIAELTARLAKIEATAVGIPDHIEQALRDPAVRRFYLAHNRMPNEDETEALRAGETPPTH